MPLKRGFKENVQARVHRDARFRKALLKEGIECLLGGDVETGKAFLRNLIHATVGFAQLAQVTHHSTKSLMRMLGSNGNPTARNLFEIVAYLQKVEGVRLQVRSVRR